VGDESEGAVEGRIIAVILMGADAFGEAPEQSGEAAVGQVAGVAECAQGDFRGLDILACFLGQGCFSGEVGALDSGEVGVWGLVGPAGEEVSGAVEDVVMAELLHGACREVAAALQGLWAEANSGCAMQNAPDAAGVWPFAMLGKPCVTQGLGCAVRCVRDVTEH
jgi:hypothetical protein